MITQQKQALKRFAYICLSFSSIVISSGVSAKNGLSENFVDHPVRGGHISVSQPKKNIAEEFEERNLIGPNSTIFKQFEDETQKDLKKPPQDGKALRKVARRAAKDAAREAAERAAYSFLKDTEEAQHLAKSIMKGKRLKEKKDQRESQLLHHVQNHALNAARSAAVEAAYNALRDETESLRVVQSLKLEKYAKKENPEGGEAARPSITQKFKTLDDLKANRTVTFRGQATPSPLNQAKTATEIGSNTIKTGLKIGDFILKFL